MVYAREKTFRYIAIDLEIVFEKRSILAVDASFLGEWSHYIIFLVNSAKLVAYWLIIF